jgi:hypothetical protein
MARWGCKSGLLALGLGLALPIGQAAERNEDWVRKQIEQIQKGDNAWRQIPWVASLVEARRVSQRERQPLFLFTHEGNIETGRC